MRYVFKKKHLIVNSLFRRLKYKNNSNSSREDIEEFLNYELKYLKFYYLLAIVYEERVKINFGDIKYKEKAFVNTKKGENNNKNFKSPKDDFSINRNENYNSTRILNSELKYSEKY